VAHEPQSFLLWTGPDSDIATGHGHPAGPGAGRRVATGVDWARRDTWVEAGGELIDTLDAVLRRRTDGVWAGLDGRWPPPSGGTGPVPGIRAAACLPRPGRRSGRGGSSTPLCTPTSARWQRHTPTGTGPASGRATTAGGWPPTGRRAIPARTRRPPTTHSAWDRGPRTGGSGPAQAQPTRLTTGARHRRGTVATPPPPAGPLPLRAGTVTGTAPSRRLRPPRNSPAAAGVGPTPIGPPRHQARPARCASRRPTGRPADRGAPAANPAAVMHYLRS
jgi:hypothetical protein